MTEAPRVAVDATSIEDRVQARLAQKQGYRDVTVSVDGYEDLFAARYRAITYKELRGIGMRNAAILDPVERELATAADVLAIACEEVFEVTPDGERVSFGLAWGPPLAARLGLGTVKDARQCLLALFVDHIDLVAHQDVYLEWRDTAVAKAAEETVGKSGN